MSLRALRSGLATLTVVTAIGVVAAAASARPVASTGTRAATHAGALVTVKSTQSSVLGSILANASGRTLYHYGPDTRTLAKCVGSCAVLWPPLLIATGVKPVAAPGVTAGLLGTVKRPDGKLQVTYGGKPLYLYSGDKKSGDVKGQGSGGTWHAIAPSGAIVTKTVKVSSGSGGSTGSGSGSTSGSGSGSGTGGSGGTGGGDGTPTDCDKNPGGYGCM